MIIYKITNKVNSKSYIGCTTKSLEERWAWHLRSRFNSKTIFSKALRKYGKECFKTEIIQICESFNEMLSKEIYWIAFYNATNREFGYNMIEGGNKPPILRGDEHHMRRNGMSEKMKLALRKANIGRKQTSEHIEKCRLTRIGKKASPEHIEKCRIARAGFRHTEESKRKVSDSKKGTVSPKRKLVLCINNYKVYNGHTEAAEKLSLSRSAVTKVANGEWVMTKGYKFQNLTSEHLIF